jgi:hypothetical protein
MKRTSALDEKWKMDKGLAQSRANWHLRCFRMGQNGITLFAFPMNLLRIEVVMRTAWICVSALSVVVAFQVYAQPPIPQATLSPKTEKAVRNAVYSGELHLAHPLEGKFALLEVVEVPAAVEAAYKENPAATLKLLLSVAEGGRPWDSVKALSFAMAMVEDPAVASVVVSLFQEKTYDEVDVDWEVTPRQHWLGKVKAKIEKTTPKK